MEASCSIFFSKEREIRLMEREIRLKEREISLKKGDAHAINVEIRLHTGERRQKSALLKYL